MKKSFKMQCGRRMTANVYGLAKWGNLTHKSRLELLMFNKNTKDE